MAEARCAVTSTIICGLSKPQKGRVPSICAEYAMFHDVLSAGFQLKNRKRQQKARVRYARATSVRKRNALPFMGMAGDERDFLFLFFYVRQFLCKVSLRQCCDVIRSFRALKINPICQCMLFTVFKRIIK